MSNTITLIGVTSLFWLLLEPAAVMAFEVESVATNGEHVHENITREALSNTPGMNSWAVESIVDGNVAADKPLRLHKLVDYIHVNSANTRNNQFDNSQSFIRGQINEAVAWGQNNPRFLSPRHSNLSGVLEELTVTTLDVGTFCLLRANPCSPELPGVLAEIALVDASDPHSNSGKKLKDLSPILTRLIGELNQFSDPTANDFQDALRDLRLEIRAYIARQYLGHAFHTIQDFYAHSNATELLYGKTGPRCSQTTYGSELCATQAIYGNPVSREIISSAPESVRNYIHAFYNRPAIDRNSLRSALNADDFARLETGYVKTLTFPVFQSMAGLRLHQSTCPEGEAERNGFNYCHWAVYDRPGLNKDSETAANHEFANKLAVISTQILWEDFLVLANLLEDLPELDLETLSAREGHFRGSRNFRVSLDKPAEMPVTFKYTFASVARPNIASAIGGESCSATVDYIASSGFAQINAGSDNVDIVLSVCGDSDIEPSEVLQLRLTSLRMTAGGERQDYILTIQSDDIDSSKIDLKLADKEIFKNPDLTPANPKPWKSTPKLPTPRKLDALKQPKAPGPKSNVRILQDEKSKGGGK